MSQHPIAARSSSEQLRQAEDHTRILPPISNTQLESCSQERNPDLHKVRIPSMSRPYPSPHEPSHDSYRPENSSLHPLDYSEQHPTAPLKHILHDPDLGPKFVPVHETQFEFTAGSKQPEGQEDAPPQTQRRQQKKIVQRRGVREDDYARLPVPPRYIEQDRGQASQRPLRPATTRPMQISDLISGNGHNSVPAPAFYISLRQQPIAARACGFGERDRRVVDPPPILQMTINDPEATPDEINFKLRYPFSVIHCELWNAETDNEETAMPEMGERRQQRRLMGTLVASPFYGRDELGQEGCFFCFPDLSCRTPGKYRLRFVLVILDPASMRPGDKSPFRAIAMSQPFQVYAAKDFPGMERSTELTKRLKEQGCLISVKKGNTKLTGASGQSHARLESADGGDDDNEEDEEDEEEYVAQSSSKTRGKRVRK